MAQRCPAPLTHTGTSRIGVTRSEARKIRLWCPASIAQRAHRGFNCLSRAPELPEAMGHGPEGSAGDIPDPRDRRCWDPEFQRVVPRHRPIGHRPCHAPALPFVVLSAGRPVTGHAMRRPPPMPRYAGHSQLLHHPALRPHRYFAPQSWLVCSLSCCAWKRLVISRTH